ncbi:MAG: hypothetical protein PHU06_01430 [Gallionella sp.]|nr:hypothetical protein [Gallionella sp.]MDD4957890.1 hypothetical protein [Gallionella sp.]
MNTLIRPTDNENAAITTAALSDPDALLLTDIERVQVCLSGSDFAQSIHKHFADLGLDELPIPPRQVWQVR